MPKPPLYRVDAPARGKKPAAKIYALDEGELEATLDKLRKEGARDGSWSISRFKGLGEMPPASLKETTMDPKKRTLLRVVLPPEDRARTSERIEALMGRKPELRFQFIQENAASVEAEALDA